MPLKKSEYKEFVYLWYHRQDFRDSVSLKRELTSLQIDASERRDVVVDFSACNSLISAEITSLVRTHNVLKGSPRFLRIIANPKVALAIAQTNMSTLGNVVVYNDQKSFIEAVKNAGVAMR